MAKLTEINDIGEEEKETRESTPESEDKFPNNGEENENANEEQSVGEIEEKEEETEQEKQDENDKEGEEEEDNGNEDNENESKSSKEENGNVSEPEDGVFTIQEILKHKKHGRQMLFLVRWLGYGADADSWEPEDSFLDKACLRAYKTANNLNTSPASKAKHTRDRSVSSQRSSTGSSAKLTPRRSSGVSTKEEGGRSVSSHHSSTISTRVLTPRVAHAKEKAAAATATPSNKRDKGEADVKAESVRSKRQKVSPKKVSPKKEAVENEKKPEHGGKRYSAKIDEVTEAKLIPATIASKKSWDDYIESIKGVDNGYGDGVEDKNNLRVKLLWKDNILTGKEKYISARLGTVKEKCPKL
ncbi:hypothetical protein HK100_008330, partial [Physocladia obscura]